MRINFTELIRMKMTFPYLLFMEVATTNFAQSIEDMVTQHVK